MTTLIIDPDNRVMYSDSRGTQEFRSTSILGSLIGAEGEVVHTTYYENTKKIYEDEEYTYCGAGSLDQLESFVASVGHHTLEEGTTVFMASKATGVCLVFESTLNTLWKRLLCKGKYKMESSVVKGRRTQGSGQEVCAARIKAGMTYESAIKSTSNLDPYTNDRIQCRKW